MQTIILLLNPGRLTNPDMDLRYLLPDRIEEVSGSRSLDNGYDFLDAEKGQPGPLMGIWLTSVDAQANWPIVLDLLRSEQFKGNDLSKSAQIYISQRDTDELENCTLVFPQ